MRPFGSPDLARLRAPVNSDRPWGMDRWRAAPLPVSNCPETVHRFMCRSHWAALPRAVRDALWRSWRSGHGVGTPMFAVAVESAMLIAV
jgi:hypothetical protein